MKNLKNKKIYVLKERDNLFNTDEIKNQVLRKKKKNEKNQEHHENRTVNDFIFLTLLNGNDYFPKLKGFNYILSLEEYFKSENYLIDFNSIESTISIDWNLFFKILKTTNTYDKKKGNQKDSLNKELNPKVILLNLFSKTLGKNLIFKDESSGIGNWKVDVYFEDKKLIQDFGTTKKEAHKNVSLKILNEIKNEKFLLKFLPEHVKPSEMIFECDRILNKVEEEGEGEGEGERKVDKDEVDDNVIDIQNLLQNYFEGVIWVLKYLSGECSDYSFYFKFNQFSTEILKKKKKI